jgi:hypothetical protein
MFSIPWSGVKATTNRWGGGGGIIISPCLGSSLLKCVIHRVCTIHYKRMTIISELPPTLYRAIAAFVEEALHVDDDLVEPFKPF